MKQVLIKQGAAVVQEVPAPTVEPGTVLVRVDHSCISIGTEMSGVRTGGDPLWRRALKNPASVARAVKMATQIGVQQTKAKALGATVLGDPTGYSAAGTVLEVGEGVTDLAPGDRVACAGAQFAHHAEYIRVPRNLVVPVPSSVDFASASTVTLGAIAMQGVRRADPTLGETFVVVGLGILGQLAVQMLKANGCRVVGIDLDPRRADIASAHGMDAAIGTDEVDAVGQVFRITDGYGADGVIITAATPSSEVLSTAFKMCRRKGRVVLVGDVGLDIRREDIYAKELDFLVSTSYGPGRYDEAYEVHGLEYPIGYVRWTENRNMAEYLRLVQDGRLTVEGLVERVYPVDEAPAAYSELKSGENKPLMVLLSYPAAAEPAHKTPNPMAVRGRDGAVEIALVGAGSFAKGVHLPNIKAHPELFTLRAVASRTGQNAAATALEFGAEYSATSEDELLSDAGLDAVLIATRHNLHAGLALRALEAGKHVLVEKPLALSVDELTAISEFYSAAQLSGASAPVLLTGFNRRFSPFARRIKELTVARSNPMTMVYRMNAGYIPLDSWVHTEEGGGRNLGEACHIYDLFTYLTGAHVVSTDATSIVPGTAAYARNDNFSATFAFDDGSLATLVYTASGSKEYPKEHMEVFCDGKTYVLEDYTALTVYGSTAAGLTTKEQDKGHAQEMVSFAKAIKSGGEWPIELWEQVQATQMALDVERLLGGHV